MKNTSTALQLVKDGPLLDVEQAAQILARCRTVDEVKEIRNQAVAVHAYLREKKAAEEAQADAAEIVLRANTRLGEITSKVPRAVSGPGRGKKGVRQPDSFSAWLAEVGLDRQQASVFEEIARIPEKTRASYFHRARAIGEEISRAGLFRYAGRTEARVAKHAARPPVIFTAYPGDNGDLLAYACQLYALPRSILIDVTYGHGGFWTATDTSIYDFRPSDLYLGPKKYNFKQLPYEDGTIDIEVFDPPYLPDAGRLSKFHTKWGTSPRTYGEVMEGFVAGMTEAMRVLKPGGLLWVKCMDQIVASGQGRQTIDVYNEALRLGFEDQDQFQLVTSASVTHVHRGRQLHARKNISVLWIFKKPKR